MRCLAPREVFLGHPHDQLADLAQDTGTPRTSSDVDPFPRDELPMPPLDRVRRDQRRLLSQGLSSDRWPFEASRPPRVIDSARAGLW